METKTYHAIVSRVIVEGDYASTIEKARELRDLLQKNGFVVEDIDVSFWGTVDAQ